MCFWLGFRILISSYLGLRKSCFGFLSCLVLSCLVLSWFGFSASEAALLVESLLCCIAVPKGLFGVQSTLSTEL